MVDFPVEVRSEQDLSAIDFKLKLKDERLQHALIRYLNLCSEEFFLQSCGALPEGIWSIWSVQIAAMFKSKMFQAAWKEMGLEKLISGYPDFSGFVRDCMK